MILFKKTIRAMLRNKKAYISCILLMSIGVALYISFAAAVSALKNSAESFYIENNLADISAKVTAISQSEIARLEEIDGIKEVYPRIVEDLRVEHSKSDDIMTLRVVSKDFTYDGTTLNEYSYEGRDITYDNEILLGVEYMNANDLVVGDTIDIVHSGKVDTFTIVGFVMSPEFVYLMKDGSDFMPDKKGFGYAYVTLKMMNSLSNMDNQYNSLLFTLEDGYTYEDVKINLEDVLDDYGLINLTKKEDMLSYSMVDLEIQAIEKMATAMPLSFLAMVSMILYLTLKRVIEQERMEIGMLKAFGYLDKEILNHFLIYGVITGMFGGFLGIIMGYLMGDAILAQYAMYFILPIETTLMGIDSYVIGFILALASGIIGTYFGVRKILKLSPVDAMKNEVPNVNVKKSFSENKFLKKILKTSGFMAIRNIQRNMLRSGFIVVGIAFSFAMGAYMVSATNLIDGMIFVQIEKVKKYDVKLSFYDQVDSGTVEYIQDYEGVTVASGIYETPVTIRKGSKSTVTNLIGLPSESPLYKAYDEETKSNKVIGEEGIVLSSFYADEIGAKKGDYIYIDSYLLEDSIKLKVTDIATMTMSDAVFMNIDTLYDYFDTDGYTSVVLNTDNYEVIKNDFKEASNIKLIEDKEKTLQNLTELISTYDIMFDFMDIFTIALVFIIIYNISVIAFSERAREYSTLKVIGVTTKEIAEIVDLEFWILTAVGIFFGIFCALGLKIGVSSMMDISTFSFDTKLRLNECVRAGMQCIIAVYLSNLMNKKNIKVLDLVTVLKERG
ncbi:MAG: ABC transporter permease [Lachnospirales bacterium]